MRRAGIQTRLAWMIGLVVAITLGCRGRSILDEPGPGGGDQPGLDATPGTGGTAGFGGTGGLAGTGGLPGSGGSIGPRVDAGGAGTGGQPGGDGGRLDVRVAVDAALAADAESPAGDATPGIDGVCAPACAADEVCNRGRCRPNCQGRFTECDGQCVETMTDPMNCGACGTRCAPAQMCRGGICR